MLHHMGYWCSREGTVIEALKSIHFSLFSCLMQNFWSILVSWWECAAADASGGKNLLTHIIYTLNLFLFSFHFCSFYKKHSKYWKTFQIQNSLYCGLFHHIFYWFYHFVKVFTTKQDISTYLLKFWLFSCVIFF
jgi:hypothetical protein